MNRKFIVFPLVALFLIFSCVPQLAQADGDRKKGGYHKELDEKILYKAKLMLKNEDELELSDKQIDKIKELKIAVKKELITRGAEIDLIKVDIKSKLYDDKIDVPGINKLIDEKYKLKSAKAKYLVKTYADLKNVLTKKQMEEFKALCRKAYKK
jgi:Spy/CpxP family protein refolding chaperone